MMKSCMILGSTTGVVGLRSVADRILQYNNGGKETSRVKNLSARYETNTTTDAPKRGRPVPRPMTMARDAYSKGHDLQKLLAEEENKMKQEESQYKKNDALPKPSPKDDYSSSVNTSANSSCENMAEYVKEVETGCGNTVPVQGDQELVRVAKKFYKVVSGDQKQELENALQDYYNNSSEKQELLRVMHNFYDGLSGEQKMDLEYSLQVYYSDKEKKEVEN